MVQHNCVAAHATNDFARWVTGLIAPASSPAATESWLKRARAVSGDNVYAYADLLDTMAFDRIAGYRTARPAPVAAAPEPIPTAPVDASHYASVAGC